MLPHLWSLEVSSYQFYYFIKAKISSSMRIMVYLKYLKLHESRIYMQKSPMVEKAILEFKFFTNIGRILVIFHASSNAKCKGIIFQSLIYSFQERCVYIATALHQRFGGFNNTKFYCFWNCISFFRNQVYLSRKSIRFSLKIVQSFYIDKVKKKQWYNPYGLVAILNSYTHS